MRQEIPVEDGPVLVAWMQLAREKDQAHRAHPDANGASSSAGRLKSKTSLTIMLESALLKFYSTVADTLGDDTLVEIHDGDLRLYRPDETEPV